MTTIKEQILNDQDSEIMQSDDEYVAILDIAITMDLDGKLNLTETAANIEAVLEYELGEDFEVSIKRVDKNKTGEDNG
tara:strand:- start:1291 stop:1524 length:234 start_codon:yes stop_codon:yes gene_type:complete